METSDETSTAILLRLICFGSFLELAKLPFHMYNETTYKLDSMKAWNTDSTNRDSPSVS